MSEPRRWTLKPEHGKDWNWYPPSFEGPELRLDERVDVIEAAPVEAELERLRGDNERLRKVLENIRYAYDTHSNEIPDVDAAIEAQVREALEASE